LNEFNYSYKLPEILSQKDFKANVFQKIVENPEFKASTDGIPKTVNSVGAVLHSIAALAPFVVPKRLADKLDEFATGFARYVVPISVQLLAGIKALAGKRGIEALSRLASPFLFFSLPLYNFNFAYAVINGVNSIHDQLHETDGENYQDRSFSDNFKRIKKNFFQQIKDIRNGNLKFSPIKDFLRGSLSEGTNKAGIMAVGSTNIISSVLGYIFTHDERDSPLAKLLGYTRNLSGSIGNLIFIAAGLNKGKSEGALKRKQVGLACMFGDIFGILQRAIPNEKVSRIFSHALLAADNIGNTIWASLSEDRNNFSKYKIEEHSV
jgi:hypothetical protein